MSSVITPKQRDRLLNRPGDASDEKVLKDRRLNDFYVRKALNRWLGSIQDINLALKTLPERQLSELFRKGTQDEDIFALLEIAERSLVDLDFMPIQRNEDGKLIAIKSLTTDPLEGGSPRTFSIEREATDTDKNRHSALEKHIARLEKFVHPLHGAIYNGLDCTYLKDLIKIAKKEGYVPIALPEQDRFLPRLTPSQQQFERRRAVLSGFGIWGIEYPSDLETFKEAMRSAEGKALIKKFESMRDEQTTRPV